MTFGSFRIACLLLAFLLAGCFGSTDPDKPVYDIRNAPIPVPYPMEKPTPPGGTRTATNSVPAGGQSITVQKGDTVYAISRRTGVEPQAIIAANSLKPPYTLHPGDQLVLSAAAFHSVKKGDTLYSISRTYGVDLATLTRLNGLRAPYTLAIGQKIRIPSGITPQRTAERQKTLNVPIPAREGSKFQWPVKGQILSSYGPKDGGLHNDGINIKTRRGEPIKAADAGVVVYASDGLKGYGNLVLIRHDGGWVTAYAHNDRLLVEKGDSVRRGDVIAWAGVTGGVDEPQLHFEIRKGTRAVDPVQYLDG